MRPTFDRRLWILLFLILLPCTETTFHQNITTVLQQTLKQKVFAQSLVTNASGTGKTSYTNTMSNVSGDIKQNPRDPIISSSSNINSSRACANCSSAEKNRNVQGSYQKPDQHLQPQMSPAPPPPYNYIRYIAATKPQTPTSSTNTFSNVTSKYLINSPAPSNRLQHHLLQLYLDQQSPSSEDAAQELIDQQHYHRRLKRQTVKSSDISLTSSGVLSSEEFTIDDNTKLSSDIRKSDIRINKTKITSSAASSPSSSSLQSSSFSPYKSPSDSTILASIPAFSTPALLYSQQYISQESLLSSFEDLRRTSVNSNTKISSSSSSSRLISKILPMPNHMQIEVSDKRHNDSKGKQKSVRALNKKEPIIIIDDAEEFESIGGDSNSDVSAIASGGDNNSEFYLNGKPMVMPLRPIIRGPYEDEHDEEMSVVYAEQHTEVRLLCEVDLDIALSSWYKNGLSVHAIERSSRITDYRFVKEINGALTITNVMMEDDGKWQCEAENVNAYIENARPVKLVVLDRPKPPYLLIDSRRLDAGNIFVPVKENSELNLACISEGGNPMPTLTWEVLLSPGVDRHAQKVAAEVLELEEIKKDKDKLPYKLNAGAKSEARLPAVYRAHHNARILCVMEHPTLKIRQNASLLLDVQYTPSFAISRTPGFGYPLREGIEVSLKCDVDSNPPSIPRWQKDDTDTPVSQTGDGFLNFTSIRREHSGWYKCTSRHLNFQYSSIGYYLSVRYDSVDVTSEPDDQDISVAASHNPNKGHLEVQLGGAVTLQCPQGSLGCWSQLDPVTARLRGLGHGLSTPTGQFSLKDVVYQDAGTYKCVGQSSTNKKKLEVLQTVGLLVKGLPTVVARNATPAAYPGSPLHLSVEFCANPPAHAARWLHGDRVFTPGNQYGSTVLAYGVTDLPTPYCKEARLTYVSMHERVPRTFYFIVSSPTGVAEAVFKVNFTMRYRTVSNNVDDEEEELSEPEEIHFPVFGSGAAKNYDLHSLNAALPQMLVLSLSLYRF